MMAASQRRRWLAGIALLTMVLRVLVPSGYMPAALAGGWYLSLCPHGMPNPAAVTALANSAHHGHHGAGHQLDHHHDHVDHTFDHCELGSGLTLSATLATVTGFELPQPARLLDIPERPAPPRQLFPRAYDSRAPPPTAHT